MKETDEKEEKAQICVVRPESSNQVITLCDFITISRPWYVNHPDQIKGEQLITYWLCDTMNSYREVENSQFIELLRHINKRFKVPPRKDYKDQIIS